MPDPLSSLIAELAKLPGVGPRTATRLAHHVLRASDDEARALAEAIVAVKERLHPCSICKSITEEDPCAICRDPARDRTRICVVEEPFNIQPLERTREYRGLYHVLGGALSPQRGVGPEELAIGELLSRLERSPDVAEIILATNPNVEGEATALYLARLLSGRNLALTRLAFGMPIGGDIDYTDEVTLGRSLAGRREIR